MFQKIKLFNSIIIIYFFSVVNFLFSVFLQVFLAFLFGTKTDMDAYMVAMNVPMIVTSLILSFEAVFVPSLKSLSLQKTEKKTADLVNTIFNFLALILIILSALSVLFSSKIIPFFAPGFSPETKALTRALFCIMMPSIVFSGLAAFLTSVYHFEEKFALVAFAPIANIAIMIISTFFLNSAIGIKSVAWGVLFGSATQFFILSSGFLFKKQYSFKLDAGQRELIKIAKNISWLAIGGVSMGSILVFEKFLASRLPEGSISVLGYAGRVISLVVLFPSVAIPTVFLPQLSTYHVLNDINSLRDLLSKGIRMTFLCVFPLTALLVVFRMPLIQLLFKRGAFDSVAVNNTSVAVVCYLGVLIALGVTKVITTGFLAIHDVFVPAMLMIGGFLIYACIAPPLSRLFSFKGLAAAFSSVCIISMIVEIYILNVRLKGINGRDLFESFSKILFCSLIMGIATFLVFNRLPSPFFKYQNLVLVLRMAVSILIGFLFFNISCFLFRVREMKFAYELLQTRLNMFSRKI